MSYLALYRRYRPNSFSTVYGQKSQIRSLQNAVAKQMVHHSYVFAGPRGTGKTSVARIFAKAVNCQSPVDGDCCNKCENCLLINSGTAIDVVEIDAASNNGVDEVRKLIEGVAYLPVALHKKVYIVDEAHMLTTSAWNALLKTLEEPPPYVIFIIATTEPNKIPLTILSRSQRYDFLRIPDSELVKLLTMIATKEKIKFEPAAINRIASLSQGGARDAIGVLDQLSLSHGNHLAEQQVVDSFNLVETEQVVALAKSLLENELSTATNLLDQFYEQGKSLPGICNDLLSVLVEIALFSPKTTGFAFLNPLTGNALLPLQPKAVAMAHRLVGFMTALRSFEINRHHYRLLAIELTNEPAVESSASMVSSKTLPLAHPASVRSKERFAKPTSPEIAEPPLPVLDKPLPAEFVAPTQVESAIEMFPIELPAYVPSTAELVSSKKPEKKKADDQPAKLVPDLASSRLSNEDLTLAVMYLNDNVLKETLQNKLQDLEHLFVDHPREAALYREGRVLVACAKGVVILFEQESRATLFNEDIKKFNHELFVTTLFGASYRVVAVDKTKAKQLGEKMMTMKKNGNIPPAVQVLQEKDRSTGDSAFDFATELFGEGIKVV